MGTLIVPLIISFILQCFPGCPEGFYGIGCQQRCLCSNGGRCDHVTGDCNCTAGWTGFSCERGKLVVNKVSYGPNEGLIDIESNSF